MSIQVMNIKGSRIEYEWFEDRKSAILKLSKKRISQAEIARRLGVSRQYVNEVLKGNKTR